MRDERGTRPSKMLTDRFFVAVHLVRAAQPAEKRSFARNVNVFRARWKRCHISASARAVGEDRRGVHLQPKYKETWPP